MGTCTTERPDLRCAAGGSSAAMASASGPARRGSRRRSPAPRGRARLRRGRVAQQIPQRRLEFPLVAHLDRGAPAEERRGNLPEVLHVRAEHDRLAEHRRLEDVVPARRHEAAADEHDRGRPGRAAPARRSCRARRRRRAARRRWSAPCGAPSSNPSSRASCSTSPKRSGWRGAMTSSAVGAPARIALERLQHGEFLARHRGAGHDHRAVRRARGRSGARGSRAIGAGRGARRLERVELQVAGDLDAGRVGAEVDEPAADSLDCMQKRSTSASTRA